MRNGSRWLLFGLMVLPISPLFASDWNFDVYLDGKKVGTHTFEVSDSADLRHVQSSASFKVKFLFFSAYRYQHTNIERWSDNCLLKFDAKTKVNGKTIEVSGATADAGFVVEKNEDKELLPDCVMSFAYWNPLFLKQEQLLNPQTGEFLDVDIKLMGTETLEVRGEMVATQRYKITAKDINILVWYSDDNEWVGLESVAKKGRIIRYKLS